MSDFVPGYEASAWYGLGAPKGTPHEIVEALNRTANAILADEKPKARFAALGASLLPGSAAEVRTCKNELRLRGVTVSPPTQDFHPSDSRAMAVYAAAEELNMPVLFHPGGTYTEQSKMEFGRPG